MSSKPAKRTSSRISVLSKAMKYVDEDTRREFKDKRIQSLEADNYDESVFTQTDDGAYGEDDADATGTEHKKKKAKKSAATPAKSKWIVRQVKPLQRLLMEAGVSPDYAQVADDNPPINYYTIAAAKSIYPARNQFCSVCGLLGSYTCTRCGSRFCSIKCNLSHKETRCFKFSY